MHTCVGASLGRAQARIAVRTLVGRLPGLALEPGRTIRLQASVNVRGPLALQLSW